MLSAGLTNHRNRRHILPFFEVRSPYATTYPGAHTSIQLNSPRFVPLPTTHSSAPTLLSAITRLVCTHRVVLGSFHILILKIAAQLHRRSWTTWTVGSRLPGQEEIYKKFPGTGPADISSSFGYTRMRFFPGNRAYLDVMYHARTYSLPRSFQAIRESFGELNLAGRFTICEKRNCFPSQDMLLAYLCPVANYRHRYLFLGGSGGLSSVNISNVRTLTSAQSNYILLLPGSKLYPFHA